LGIFCPKLDRLILVVYDQTNILKNDIFLFLLRSFSHWLFFLLQVLSILVTKFYIEELYQFDQDVYLSEIGYLFKWYIDETFRARNNLRRAIWIGIDEMIYFRKIKKVKMAAKSPSYRHTDEFNLTQLHIFTVLCLFYM
jgi:hypothetical protein